MDRSQVITLVGETKVQDDLLVWHSVPTSRRVYCQVDSVTQTEFFEGGRNGLNPEYRFTLFGPDYGGERTVIFKSLAYGVYRTYKAKTDMIELYCERKGGTNGIAEDNG